MPDRPQLDLGSVLPSWQRLYWDTVIRLPPKVLWGQLRWRLRRKPVVFEGAAPARASLRDRLAAFAPQPSRMTGPEAGCYINIAADFSDPAVWSGAEKPLLWLYNLHYFDDLGAEGAAQVWRAGLIPRWLQQVAPGEKPAWDPYVLSRRIPAWIKWLLEGNDAFPGMIDSLFAQSLYMEQTVETHLYANHIFANAKALFFAGLFFDGAEGARLRRLAERLLARELKVQVLEDGAHFELSPGYHAIIYEDVLDLLNLARAYGVPPVAGLEDACRRMGDWMAAMIHPDGGVTYFNDGALGLGATPDQLFDYAQRLGFVRPQAPAAALTDLVASGYARLAAGDMVLFVDAAPVAPRVQPGHAHADTLSFELSCRGRRVLVNGGASTYDKNVLRQGERGSAAHNTLRLGRRNSTDVWGGFRVGCRARITGRAARQMDAAAEVRASHDGYANLPGQPVHDRTWQLDASGLRIEDAVSLRQGAGLPLELYFHVHPDFAVQADGGAFLLQGPDGIAVRLVPDPALDWSVQTGHWTLEPRLTRPNAVLVGKGALQGPIRLVTHVEMAR